MADVGGGADGVSRCQNKHAFCLEAITARDPWASVRLPVSAHVEHLLFHRHLHLPSPSHDSPQVTGSSSADPRRIVVALILSFSAGYLVRGPIAMPPYLRCPFPYPGPNKTPGCTSAGVTGCCRR